MTAMKLSGGCLCGAVRFSAKPEALEMSVCHCSMCRKWSGGVFMPVACGDSVEFEASNAIGNYQSSKWGQRIFCNKCGSTLMWKMTDGSFHGVAASAFDDQTKFVFTHQGFIDEKPDNYTFANETENMTGAEGFAKYAAKMKERSDG